MPELTIVEWGVISQLILAVFTLAGIITSIVISIKVIKEVHRDRQLRHIPHLAFEPGGFKMPVELNAGTREESDIDSTVATGPYANLPIEEITIKMLWKENSKWAPSYGILKNFGLGPALGAKVNWIAQEVTIGSDTFRIDEEKLLEHQYGCRLNSMPVSPSHILAGESSHLTRLPNFIVQDHEIKISKVSGFLEIKCLDVFNQKHSHNQNFIIHTQYDDAEPYLIITFGRLDETTSGLCAGLGVIVGD